ncbi:undecaprenyl-diphosphatase 2 [Flexivirga endophytica]|uniref:Undecaprenyl-diphosphatase n=1 Tax=Flexivirga endophytica TaxID=1849103 RepID=A0A916ST61_9MICO|nr:undecaprenyl-diphosphate phosphatase [Flexivirga endophytica]GGB16875.1 undecaprenyl-diphosphatase 2 [Flexivirga endophytica]GHB38661.1 undecaprenyl-diphosphatase 2 [Flexivirga endophytica]
MTWIEAIVLGIVQGLTEFLPISSSAHQLIVGRLFWDNDGGGSAFTAVNQLGTETAVIVYFWRDIVRIIKQWALSVTGKVPRTDPDARMGWLVIVGTIPIGILGLVLKDFIEGDLRNLWVTASMLLIFAIVIAVADSTVDARTHSSSERQVPVPAGTASGDTVDGTGLAADGEEVEHGKTLDDLTVKDGIRFGLWQALALIPGVSRSGGTISGGLLMGYTRSAAARYSFLLAIPAVVISGLFELKDLHGSDGDGWGQIAVATLLAFVVGYAVVAWFMRYISHHNFRPFVYYRIALAVFLFGLLVLGKVAA